MKNFKRELHSENFQNSIWQKKCFHFKAALNNQLEDFGSENMLEMASDNYFHSKVIEKGKNWKVYEESHEFNFETSKNPWTLLVHNLDKYFLSIKEILAQFDIFPKWSFDDVMGSFSSEGSISPAHIDNYNVFLIQLKGSRRWKIQYNPKDAYLADQPLKILESFIPEEEFILKPGDILYIPSQVAHQGESLNECLSLSVGVQSINLKEILFNLLDQDLAEYFLVPPLSKTPVKESNFIDHNSLELIKQDIFKRYFNSQYLNKAILQYLAKAGDNDKTQNEDDFLETFKSSGLVRDELSSMVATKQGSEFLICIDEIDYLGSQQEFEELDYIFNQNLNYVITPENHSNSIRLLEKLYEAGVLFANPD